MIQSFAFIGPVRVSERASFGNNKKNTDDSLYCVRKIKKLTLKFRPRCDRALGDNRFLSTDIGTFFKTIV